MKTFLMIIGIILLAGILKLLYNIYEVIASGSFNTSGSKDPYNRDYYDGRGDIYNDRMYQDYEYGFDDPDYYVEEYGNNSRVQDRRMINSDNRFKSDYMHRRGINTSSKIRHHSENRDIRGF